MYLLIFLESYGMVEWPIEYRFFFDSSLDGLLNDAKIGTYFLNWLVDRINERNSFKFRANGIDFLAKVLSSRGITPDFNFLRLSNRFCLKRIGHLTAKFVLYRKDKIFSTIALCSLKLPWEHIYFFFKVNSSKRSVSIGWVHYPLEFNWHIAIHVKSS